MKPGMNQTRLASTLGSNQETNTLSIKNGRDEIPHLKVLDVHDLSHKQHSKNTADHPKQSLHSSLKQHDERKDSNDVPTTLKMDDCDEKIEKLYSPRNIINYTTRVLHNSITNKKKLFREHTFNLSVPEQKSLSTPLESPRSPTTPSSPINLENVDHFVPCLLLRAFTPTNKVCLCFHGNGEDIGQTQELGDHVRSALGTHVIYVEYPKYGLYQDQDPSEERLFKDAEGIYDFLLNKLFVLPENLIVFGRSLGTAPAIWLASKKQVGILVLMSPFTSVKGIVQDLIGNFATYLVKERFENIRNIENVKCPTFIVHGQQDRLIPCSHAQALFGTSFLSLRPSIHVCCS